MSKKQEHRNVTALAPHLGLTPSEERVWVAAFGAAFAPDVQRGRVMINAVSGAVEIADAAVKALRRYASEMAW